MFEIKRMGERSIHDASFEAGRPNGYGVYLILFVHTPAQFKVNGSWRRVSPGCALMYRPGQAHYYKADGGEYCDSWIWADFQENGMEGYFPFGEPITLRDPKKYEDLFHILCGEYFSGSSRREVIIHYLGSSMLHMLAEEVNDVTMPEIYYSLVKLRSEIYKDPARDWSVSSMAKEVSVSNGYLQKIYRQYFGVTCNNEIIHSRIQAACELLGSTGMSVEEVAASCGYRNTEHFIRQFKSWIGVTPGKYRRTQVSLSES